MRYSIEFSIITFLLISGSVVSGSTRYVPSGYATVQDAIDSAGTGDTIMIAPGTYTGIGNHNIDFKGKAITVSGSNPTDPCMVAATIIDCQSNGRGFYFHTGEGVNSVLTGLTIINGLNTSDPLAGGGILCENASPTIQYCHIQNNGAAANLDYAYGGGICCLNASPTIANCLIQNNYADAFGDAFGGGIASMWSNSQPVIKNCRIVNNSVQGGFDGALSCGDAAGGGIYVEGNLTVNISDSTINGNRAIGGSWMGDMTPIEPGDALGGGIYCGNTSITNCLIVANQCEAGKTEWLWENPETGMIEPMSALGYSRGGGIYSFGSTISNSSVCYNRAYKLEEFAVLGEGSGIYGLSTEVNINNCIVWSNVGGSTQVSYATASYSDIEGGYTGTGNIGADPCFVDADGPDNDSNTWQDNDYHPKSQAGHWDTATEDWVIDDTTSPCVDAGNPADPLADEPADANNVRINMGAFGGTAQASKTPQNWGILADLTNDRIVDYNDLEVFVLYWLDAGQSIPADLSRNQSVDFIDFAAFADQWLLE